jgi:hypothetical protein
MTETPLSGDEHQQHPSCRGKEVTTMNVFAIYAVNEHISDLLAEAESRRLAREAKPNGRGLVASIRAAARSLAAARTPKLPAYSG